MKETEKRKKSEKPKSEKPKSDFEEKVLYINRCSKVVKGGRKFSFSSLIIVGNRAGKIGVGFAKANEVADAIKKSGESARKEIFEFELHGTTIPHEIISKWDGAVVMLKPAPEGKGVIAGSQVRSVLELGGVQNVVAKSLGSSNPLNLVIATVNALRELSNRESTFEARKGEA